ncbi:glycosyl transferase family 8 [Rhizobium sp. PDO1-076]|nr:glycosyl transferase family 8 [Rhizobium sp. PDO1-076]
MQSVSSAVIVCSDERMLGPACCALLSAWNNLGSVKARLFLLVVDVDAKGKRDVLEFAARHQITIEMIDLVPPSLEGHDFGYWSVATIARLYMDTLVPETISRLVYLDADTLAVASIVPLFSLDMGGHPVGAVDDCLMAFPDKMSERKSRIGMAAEARYFNAGVLLFDWSVLPETNVLKEAREIFLKDPERYPFKDQDVLNVVLAENWLALDPRWNTQTGLVPIVAKPAIQHFTGSRKPWQSSWKWMHRDARRFYRQVLLTSAWSDVCSSEPMFVRIGKMLSYFGSMVGRARKTEVVRSYFRSIRGA